MYKPIWFYVLLSIILTSKSFSQINTGIDTLYVLIQFDSKEYLVDISVSSQFRITTSNSKENYNEFLKKQSESRYLDLTSADFDPRQSYTFQRLSYPDFVLNYSEYFEFKSKITDILDFTEYEKNIKNQNLPSVK